MHIVQHVHLQDTMVCEVPPLRQCPAHAGQLICMHGLCTQTQHTSRRYGEPGVKDPEGYCWKTRVDGPGRNSSATCIVRLLPSNLCVTTTSHNLQEMDIAGQITLGQDPESGRRSSWSLYGYRKAGVLHALCGDVPSDLTISEKWAILAVLRVISRWL